MGRSQKPDARLERRLPGVGEVTKLFAVLLLDRFPPERRSFLQS
jgi:hypothetical protein